MPEIQVNFGQLSAGAESLNQAATKIQSELDELEQMLKPLIETWDGAAKEQYYEAQRKWTESAQNMREIAAKMGMAVNAANESYQAGERANAAKFGG
ncbi:MULTISPECIES: WXG100 family type VII secretion target [Actinopolyspora]|uniref:ESAT-6-like protein n=1 Tax=Actinopolyspora saharensis TaxID=995062 RepID=A0A1H1GL04_9ACTN|nr:MULTISPECIES: WXG100 family type VII secretion target [Actinopolyspora]NHD16640.1 WXG100 family type VII secretion target [Actinopolyspora sp. BKK2]NHE75497.1 WXG100 family type VII secretion target [Actinopolyspora sp. BKK1]SDR13912.1 Proteins of 100 residues with WXG [Actinopolyspora saharensis]